MIRNELHMICCKKAIRRTAGARLPMQPASAGGTATTAEQENLEIVQLDIALSHGQAQHGFQAMKSATEPI